MPAGYEHMRDAFIRKGMSSKAAKKKAAMIWNSKHKGGETVGRYSEAFCQFMEDFADEHGISDKPKELKLHHFNKDKAEPLPRVLTRKAAELKKFQRTLKLRSNGAIFGESRWEKPSIDKEEIFGRYGKDLPKSTSQKNNRSPEARKAAMDKARTPVRRVRLGEDFPGQLAGGGGNEGNEQGVAGAAPFSKDTKSLTLKKPKPPEQVIKRPEDMVKPVKESSGKHPIQDPEVRGAIAKELKGARGSYRAAHSTDPIAMGQANRDMADELRSRSYSSGQKRTLHTASFRMDSLGRKQIRTQHGPMAEEDMKIVERHQTNAYKATQATDVNLATGAVSPEVKKSLHKGLISSPLKHTAKGAYKNLSGAYRFRKNSETEESIKRTLNDFTVFMENRAERLYQDAKHSGKMEKGNVIWRRVKHTPTHIKRVGEWPDEVPSRSPINKAMKHGERQAIKRDIAKAVEESFKAVQSKIASKEGVSKDRAGAILAASSRNASAKAKKKNPKLKKVKG